MNPILRQIADFILDTNVHNFLIESVWLFPAAETVHFMGLTLFFGALLVVDIRGLGFYKAIPFATAHRLVPVILGAFSFIVLSGFIFIFTDPERYFVNIAFLTKISLILIAGINALAFEFFVFRPFTNGQTTIENSLKTKFISGLSLFIWICVLICGRSIPYVEF